MRQLARLGLFAVAALGALAFGGCDDTEGESHGQNHLPEVSALAVSSEEDSPVVINFLSSSTDADGDRLRVLTATIAGERVEPDAFGKATFLPPANFHGTMPLAFSVSDGAKAVGGVGTLTIRPVQDPVATTGSTQTLREDSSQAFSLSVTEVDGDPLTFAIVDPPAHGTLSGTAPDLVYTPAADYFGADRVRYEVSDGGSTAAAVVSFNVVPVNDAPAAVAKTVALNEDSALAFALEGTDLDGDLLTYAVSQQPAHGVLLGSGANRTYQPSSNYFGPDEIRFVVSDGLLTSGVATVTFNVVSVDDPTTAQPVTVAATEDTAALVTLRGADADGTPVSYTTSAPAHGTLSGTAPTLTYAPDLNYNGVDSFTYTATSEGSAPATATVTINLAAVNDAPAPVNATILTEEDTAVAIELRADDVDSSSLLYSIVSGYQGTVTGTPPNISYTPPANFAGALTLGFYASDTAGGSTRGNLTIVVAAVNDPPALAADTVATDIDEPLVIAALRNDSDVDGDALSLMDVGAPAHGSAVIEDDEILYTPSAGYTGVDEFSYTAADAAGAIATATIRVGVGEFPAGAPLETLVASSSFGGYSGPDLMPAISNDGRYIAFQTVTSLVSEDTNTHDDVYLYDRGKRALELVSKSASGEVANAGATHPRLTGDGRYLVFSSGADNLVVGDTNGKGDVFRRDLRTGEVLLLSVTSTGAQGNGNSFAPAISDDGTRVVFVSSAFNLIPDDFNGANDIFLRDLAAGTTTRVSASVSGFDADFSSFFPAISGDGRFVAFASNATNLVPDDSNQVSDVFLRELATSTTSRVSVATNGTQGDGASNVPSISRDGRFVAFSSSSSNLAPIPYGTYVRDRLSATTTAPAFSSPAPTLSGDGRYVVGSSSSSPTLVDRFGGGLSTLTPPAGTRWSWPALSGNGRYVAVVDTTRGSFMVMPNPR